ncbi:Nitrilase/cyanide hydratase and apolipoprotein N-acyltransferase [Emticicia oligotrophica DSM 17448]|uniref:Nitrilase/cyanide hydratase and apolipoprotein N-acyltransferase n=1 Tax=Emticicia oligotrophica (strain DSM 17448 / CIP 109782 / MTCC 6937 / GPTSA100-15) TaxID=929562 RepID=A0ABN4ASP6_EMTOG|nr:carbon-nitrogen hydrolase family protein [Emticicia oligotrophica]AFK04765.1 Nitrilase/cyanide hydratase and apolipoprotein N-acyltransferase [Emticicia oligotrophica DSM 17448]
MKICLAQIQSYRGEIEKNIQKHVNCIVKAIEMKADFIFFPELSISSYEPTLARTLATTPTDKRFDIFQMLSNQSNITICIGAPLLQALGVSISMLIFQKNLPLKVYSKQILHADELPYFVTCNDEVLISQENNLIAPAICFESLLEKHAEKAAKAKANLYIASVAKSTKGLEKAYNHYPKIAQCFNLTVLMCNSVGPAEDFVAKGQSAVWLSNGEVLGKLDSNSEGLLFFDSEDQTTSSFYF